MTNEFVLSELLLYIVPVIIIFVVQKYSKLYLKFFDKYPLNLAILLLPLWLTLIHLFSKLSLVLVLSHSYFLLRHLP